MASFQRAIFLPFLGNLLEQIDAPFNGLSGGVAWTTTDTCQPAEP